MSIPLAVASKRAFGDAIARPPVDAAGAAAAAGVAAGVGAAAAAGAAGASTAAPTVKLANAAMSASSSTITPMACSERG